MPRADPFERMKSEILKHYSDEFRAGWDIAQGDAESLFDALITESDESLICELLAAWISKGHSEDELFALACIMRLRMKSIKTDDPIVIDIVGTGGSRAKTFNVSTAAAFVIAGAGVSVAKHGNRAATSNAGSADVLELLGVKADVSPETAEGCLNDHGICFMFAPRFHLLSPTLAMARRRLGRPTIFNNLGPLCNPASPSNSVIGVWDKNILEMTANVLGRLGRTCSWIVHGENGLDEIALNGETAVVQVCDDEVLPLKISAANFGIEPDDGELPQKLSAGESATLIREILDNKRSGSNAENLVLINVAAAIYLAVADDLRSAFKLATESVRSGSAKAKLNALAEATNK